MAINEIDIEKLLCKDSEKIIIDDEFKCDLKNKIMFADKYKNITELPKHKNKFKKNKYFKIASGFVICVFVSGTIFKAIDIPSKNIFGKSKGTSDLAVGALNTKGLNKTNSRQSNSLKALDDIIKNNYKDKQLVAIKGTGNSVIDNKTDNNAGNTANNTIDKIIDNPTDNATNNPSQVYSDNNFVASNVIAQEANSVNSDAEINQGLIYEDHHVSPLPNIDKPIDVPNVVKVIDDNVEKPTSYDSRYSIDAKKLVSVKDGGVYIKDIKSSSDKLLITYNEKTQIVNKPNFTPTGEVIYYKANKVSLDKGAIYLVDKNGKESTIVENGEDPMISKDGKNLVYESDGKIFIQTIATKTSNYVANGKYPAFSNDGNLISYIKEETETQDTSVSAKRKANIEKTTSTLCVLNLTTEKTQSLTDNGVDIKDNQSWSGAIRELVYTGDLDVTSKYSYYESIWSLDNKEVFVIRRNNEDEKQVYELINFKLDN